MKKNDIRLMGVIILVAIVCAVFFYMKPGKQRGILKVEVDGTEFGSYSLDEEQVIEINETNRLEIKNHRVIMCWADCPDQICVQHVAISQVGESIVCLPNKVFASIIDGEENEFDAVTN